MIFYCVESACCIESLIDLCERTDDFDSPDMLLALAFIEIILNTDSVTLILGSYVKLISNPSVVDGLRRIILRNCCR